MPSILNRLPDQVFSETRNSLIYLYQIRMTGMKIDKNEFTKEMDKFENIGNLIL
jgi:hypothetical protein